MGTSQLTSKLAFQNIMNNLRLLLFFFVLLAPLQLTSAWENSEEWEELEAKRDCWDDCVSNEECIDADCGCMMRHNDYEDQHACREKAPMRCANQCNISERDL